MSWTARLAAALLGLHRPEADEHECRCRRHWMYLEEVARDVSPTWHDVVVSLEPRIRRWHPGYWRARLALLARGGRP